MLQGCVTEEEIDESEFAADAYSPKTTVIDPAYWRPSLNEGWRMTADPSGIAVITPEVSNREVAIEYPVYFSSRRAEIAIRGRDMPQTTGPRTYRFRVSIPSKPSVESRDIFLKTAGDGKYVISTAGIFVPEVGLHRVRLTQIPDPGAQGSVPMIRYFIVAPAEYKGNQTVARSTSPAWFESPSGSVFTFWGYGSLTYAKTILRPSYDIYVSGWNYGQRPLPDYYQFAVQVFLDGNHVGNIHVNKDNRYGAKLRLNVPTPLHNLGDTHRLTFTWINDANGTTPFAWDANFELHNIVLHPLN